MSIALPDLSRPGPIDLLRGFALPFRALRLLFATPKLVALTLAVAALTAVALTGLFVALWHFAPELATALWQGGTQWWAKALHGLLTAAVFVLLFAIGANVLPMTLAIPLIDPISANTEQVLGFAVQDEGGVGRVVRETLRALGNGLVRFIAFALGHALLLVLLLIPGVGAPIWTVLSWTWTALWVAAQHLDIPMARHLYSFGEEVTVIRRRLPLCFGFGAAVSLMLWVPLLNFFFVPVAVIAATLLFRGLVQAGMLPAPRALPQAGIVTPRT